MIRQHIFKNISQNKIGQQFSLLSTKISYSTYLYRVLFFFFLFYNLIDVVCRYYKKCYIYNDFYCIIHNLYTSLSLVFLSFIYITSSFLKTTILSLSVFFRHKRENFCNLRALKGATLSFVLSPSFLHQSVSNVILCSSRVPSSHNV